MLQLQQITVSKNGKQLLHNINLSVHAGELVVLLGGNGAGKSTLLKTIAGTIPYKNGQIVFQNQPLPLWRAEELATQRAVLSQNVQMVFPMKVLDVVLLGRYPFGVTTTSKDEQIALELLELMGLSIYAQRDITQLSGGEQQRVHLARVLAQVWGTKPQQPKLLLLDEPTSNLDIVYQHVLMKFIQERVSKDGLAVLTVLHDINLAARYASHIALLKNGQLLTVGSPAQSLTSDWIKTTFGVSSFIQTNPVFDCIQVLTY